MLKKWRYHIASDGESAKVFVEAIIISFHFILVRIELSVECALCPLMTVWLLVSYSHHLFTVTLKNQEIFASLCLPFHTPSPVSICTHLIACLLFLYTCQFIYHHLSIDFLRNKNVYGYATLCIKLLCYQNQLNQIRFNLVLIHQSS